MAEKPVHHQTPVVRITEVLPHSNADKLEIIPVGGYQAISVKGQFKPGDLAYYIYPDSIVPEREEYSFLWRGKVIPGEPVPLKYRRITAKRLRKEWSEGLLMPLRAEVVPNEGEDISDLLGITHYQPPEPTSGGESEEGPRRRPRTLRGWVRFLWWKLIGYAGFDTPLKGFVETGPKEGKPHYDIENFKNYRKVFEPGEFVLVTEKIHGCQGKFVYQDGKMYVGSRNRWIAPKSTTIWRKCLQQNPWIEEWCRKYEGYTLYGEVIPCQGEKFMYGYAPGEVRFKVFDILKPDHVWLDADVMSGPSDLSPYDLAAYDALDHWVPILYRGPYDEEAIRKLVDGKTTLGKSSGIREGIVVKPLTERHVKGLGRAILKLVSNDYLERN